MKPDDAEPNKLGGSRRRIAQAAKQLRLARADADGWDAEALRALEGDCYRYLTGDFRRASELIGNSETPRQAPLAADGRDEA